MLIRKQNQSRSRTQFPKTLSDTHISQLLNLFAEHPGMRDLRDVLRIVLGTGIRVRELRELRWTDVDFPQRMLSVTANPGNVRHVPLELETLRVLEERHGRQPESEYVLGTSPRVILDRVSRKLATLSISLGIGRVSLHMLRSTFIERLVSSGADISLAMSICGFSWAGFLVTHLSKFVPKAGALSHTRSNQ
jgi:integrase